MPRIKKPAVKRSPLEGYRTYNPNAEGYGSVSDWGRAFDERMGVEEAGRVLRDDDPIVIMGFTSLPIMDELKKAYRKLMMQYHPDRAGGNAGMAMKIIAAYSILEDSIRRKESHA
jgi:hypothetical protein